jgi:glycosyltransferase involved in cell wall biosynthesis
MKTTVMLVGIGNNDRGSARLASKFGRTILLQDAYIEHREVWENGERVFNGPEIKIRQSRLLAEITFGLSAAPRWLKAYRAALAGGNSDLVITSAYGQTVVALWLRATGRTRKVVCIVSDFLPPRGKFTVRVHRRLTGFFTRVVARFSDEVWAVSPRIPTAKANPKNFVLPLLIDDNGVPPARRDEIGYIGFPSPDHAVDVLFEICEKHKFKLNVFGDSPYLQSIRHRAPADTVFHGITNDNVKIGQVLARCFCGYAVYRDTSPNSYSYFGIPSKCLQLFASNVPVVTTNTAHFTQNIAASGAGCVVNPTAEEIEKAILDIRARFPVYYEAINKFRATWNAGVEKFHDEHIGALLADAPAGGN